MQHILDMINAASAFLGTSGATLIVVLGFIIGVCKAVPNSKAIPVVAEIQTILDSLASVLVALGGVVKKGADVLAEALKSNGYLSNK